MSGNNQNPIRDLDSDTLLKDNNPKQVGSNRKQPTNGNIVNPNQYNRNPIASELLLFGAQIPGLNSNNTTSIPSITTLGSQTNQRNLLSQNNSFTENFQGQYPVQDNFIVMNYTNNISNNSSSSSNSQQLSTHLPLTQSAAIQSQPYFVPYNAASIQQQKSLPSQMQMLHHLPLPHLRESDINSKEMVKSPHNLVTSNDNFSNPSSMDTNMNVSDLSASKTDLTASQHTTLGQMAEQFQERARQDARKSVPSQSNIPKQDEFVDDFDDDDDGDNEGQGQIPTGNESTGRWTRAEHELFVKALKMYGKEWKKVASMVKTRTVVQTRTHAQKYFQKLSKSHNFVIPLSTVQSSNALSNEIYANDADSTDRGFEHGKYPDSILGTKRVVSTTGSNKKSKRIEVPPPILSPKNSVHFSDVNQMKPFAYPTKQPGQSRFGHLSNAYGHKEARPFKAGDAHISQFLIQQAQQNISQSNDNDTDLDSSYMDKSDTSREDMQNISYSSYTPARFKPGNPPYLRYPTVNDNMDIPHPSPAATGKRKNAELNAIQMLLSSSSVDEGIELLSMMKKEPIHVNHPNNTILKEGGISGIPPRKSKQSNLSLSIMNPDDGIAVVESSSFDDLNGPHTPWESGIRKLEARQVMSPIYGIPVTTPSEQLNFLNRVKQLVFEANLAGLKDVLNAAEYASSTSFDETNNDHGNNADNHSDLSGIASSSNYLLQPSPLREENMNSLFPPRNYDPSLASSSSSSNDREFTNTLHSSLGAKRQLSSNPTTTPVGRSLNKADKIGRTVLMEAICLDPSSHEQDIILALCSILTEHGASAVVMDVDGNTCLHFAATMGYEKVGRLLLAKGCGINFQNRMGDTAAHLSARYHHKSFLEMLTDLGANFHLRNNLALSPLDTVGTMLRKVPEERQFIREHLLKLEPRLRTLVLYHDDCLEHSARRPSDWEAPDRLVSIMSRLNNNQEFRDFEIEISNKFVKAGVELLGRVHSPEYIAFVNNLSKQIKQSAEEAEGKLKQVPVPFTPQVQRAIMHQTSEELKNSDLCDTSFSSGTLNAARRAAGAVAHAVDCVLLGRNRNAFCVVRPPGHHAGYRGLLDGANSCGFCIFNSVAASAYHALEERNCERVAIIDLDIHHGNGTEDIVRKYHNPSRLFFFSLHLYDKEPQLNSEFFPGSGKIDDYVHNIINVPLMPLWKDSSILSTDDNNHQTNNNNNNNHNNQTNDNNIPLVPSDSAIPQQFSKPEQDVPIYTGLRGRDAYRQAIAQRLIPSLRAFNPDLILLSTGFDGATGDVGNMRNYIGQPPEKGMNLSPQDFAWATSEILKIADICCNGKLVSVLEGGYGEYDSLKVKQHAQSKTMPTAHVRHNTRYSSNLPTPITGPVSLVDQIIADSAMKRNVLSNAAAAHVHSLIDPYGSYAVNEYGEISYIE
eukprot:gene4993-6978_t